MKIKGPKWTQSYWYFKTLKTELIVFFFSSKARASLILQNSRMMLLLLSTPAAPFWICTPGFPSVLMNLVQTWYFLTLLLLIFSYGTSQFLVPSSLCKVLPAFYKNSLHAWVLRLEIHLWGSCFQRSMFRHAVKRMPVIPGAYEHGFLYSFKQEIPNWGWRRWIRRRVLILH